MNEHDQAAVPVEASAAAFSSEGRALPAGNGLEWWSRAWPLFTRQPGMWIGVMVVAGVAFFVAALIPVLGQLAGMLLWPVLVAGLMLGVREIERGGELKFSHLTAGLSADVGQLVLIGLAYLIGMIIAGGIVMLVAGIGMAAVMGAADGAGAAGIGAGGAASLLLAVLIALALLLPVYMATWFAPALVVFHGASAPDAMKASFFGCLKNMGAFLLYGVVGIVLSVVASIPFGLGWLVLGPVAVASVYVSYRDIFLTESA